MCTSVFRLTNVTLDFDLEQIVPMNEDAADDDLRIVRVSFCDPYILVLRHDLTILVLKRDEKTGELAEIPNSGFQGTRWRSANLYQPSGQQSTPFVVLNSIRGQVQVSFSEV
jgi:hypothetical protein